MPQTAQRSSFFSSAGLKSPAGDDAAVSSRKMPHTVTRDAMRLFSIDPPEKYFLYYTA
jgi:hypothetical protein